MKKVGKPIAIINSEIDHCNFIGIARNFWEKEFVDQILDDVLSWRPVNVKYGQREVGNLATQAGYNRGIIAAIHSFNRKTYRVPDLRNSTITSGLYRYKPGHKYDWHQDIIYNLQMLKNWERIRRYSTVVMLSDPDEYTGGDFFIEGYRKPIALRKGDLLIYTAVHAHRVTPLISGNRMTYCTWLESRHYAHSLEID